MGYNIINLIQIRGKESEGQIISDLHSYECPYNKDVETFLREKAYTFACNGLSQTHLVYASYRDELVLCGYYTLSTKWLKIKRSAMPNRRMASRFNYFGTYDSDTEEYSIVAPLIGQLGKIISGIRYSH